MKNSNKTKFKPALQKTHEELHLVMAAYLSKGHVNRSVLMEMYRITHIQAGLWIRDFIHAHPQNIHWDDINSAYELKNK